MQGCLQCRIGGFNQRAASNQNQIPTHRDAGQKTVHTSPNSAFCAVSLYGVPDRMAGRNPNPQFCLRIGISDQHNKGMGIRFS